MHTPHALVSIAVIARVCQASMGHGGNGTISWYNLDLQPSEAAVCIVGEIRIGVIDVVAKHIRQTVVENNNADVGTHPASPALFHTLLTRWMWVAQVFMCVDGSIYSEIPGKYFPGSQGYEQAAPSLQFIPRDGWATAYPTLRGLKYRKPGSNNPPAGLTHDEAPCMAATDHGHTATGFRKFYPQFKGWECCLQMIEQYESESHQANGSLLPLHLSNELNEGGDAQAFKTTSTRL